MRVFYLLLSLSFTIFSAELSSLTFPTSWTLSSGATFSQDTLILTGSAGKYVKAQRRITLPSAPTNLYYTATMKLDAIIVGTNATSVPKMKIYNGATGDPLLAFNIDPLVQGEWYLNGMVLENFSKLGITDIIVEFGLQDCAGTMQVVMPQLFDTAPALPVEFPYVVPSASATLAITTTSTHPMNNNLLGINGHFVSADPVSWSDTQIKEILSTRLPLGNLRFPGGTVGNFYNWQTDGFFGDALTLSSAARKKAYDAGFVFDYPGYKANLTALQATATLMFNVIHDSPATAAAQLTSRLADGLDIAFVELGNENFFTEQSAGNVATPELYVSHTKAVSAALKAVKSDIMVAVNTNHHDYQVGGWNDLLSKENYYDACVMHPYTKTGTFLLNKPALRTMYGAYALTKERFTAHTQMFPTKPLLLTEWNILTEGAPSTFVQLLGVADQFLAILEGGDEGLVVQSGIHTLCHSDRYSEQTLYYGGVGSLRKTRLAVFYEKVVALLKDSRLYAAKISSNDVAPGLPAINGRALEVGDSIKIFAVNKLPVSAPLSISLDGVNYTGTYRIESFSEPLLGDTLGYTLLANPWQSSTGSSGITLPPSALVVITIPRGTTPISFVAPPTSRAILLHGTTLSLPDSQRRRVELFSLTGKRIWSQEIASSRFDCATLPIAHGIWTVRVSQQGVSQFVGKLTM